MGSASNQQTHVTNTIILRQLVPNSPNNSQGPNSRDAYLGSDKAAGTAGTAHYPEATPTYLGSSLGPTQMVGATGPDRTA